jgi:hypothetical protein
MEKIIPVSITQLVGKSDFLCKVEVWTRDLPFIHLSRGGFLVIRLIDKKKRKKKKWDKLNDV